MADIKKPNDIFAAVLEKPDANVFDLQKSNITPDNTSFQSKDFYKESDFVKKYFTGEDGNFDEKAFDNAYLKAYNLYLQSSNDEYLANALKWDANDLLRPVGSQVREDLPVISKDIYNPDQNLYGRTAINSIDKGLLSSREIAQTQKVKDYKTGKDLDYTPNDLGYFGALTNNTLVYATYDEDGAHTDLFSGREVKHKKGERKLNEEGNYYAEELGDREVYGKEVVNPTDLITNDTSAWNSVDIWDSDGTSKSTTKVILKTAWDIAPYLIPYGGFNLYYGGFKAATTLASIMPTLYKQFEGIALGDMTKGNETDLWKAATKAEGFAARFNTTSFSDDASKSMFSKEQMASMVSSIFSQLYEQRAVASLSQIYTKLKTPQYAEKLIGDVVEEARAAVGTGVLKEGINAKKVGEALKEQVANMLSEKQSKLARDLSTAYMALTSTSNMYEDALAAGYDRRTAGIASFAAMLGQYGIMHVEEGKMQTWFLDKGVGFDDAKSARNKIIKPILDDVEKKVQSVYGKPTEEVKKSILEKFNDLKTFFSKSLGGDNPQSIYKNSMIEGIQEVVEQSVLDATKGAFDAYSFLTGSSASFNTVSDVFSEKGLETYLSNLLGGVVGGGLFEINRLKIEPLLTGKNAPVSLDTKYSLERRIANGEGPTIRKQAAEMVKGMGNSGLSPVTVEVDGQQIHKADEDTTQADLILAGFNQYVDQVENIMRSENLLIDDKSVIRKTILDSVKENDLERTGVHKFILSDINELTSKIVDIKSELNTLDKDKDTDRISMLTEQLKANKEEFDLILSGKKSSYYTGLSLFALNTALSSPFLSLNVKDYTKSKYNTNFDELPEVGGSINKTQIQKEFNELMSNPDNNKDKLKFMYSIYKTMLGKYSNLIGEYGEENHIKVREEVVKLLQDSKLINADNIFKYAEAAKYFNITPNLDDKLDLPLGNILNENGLLDNTGLDDDTINKRVEVLNKLGTSLPFRNVSTKLLSSLIAGSSSDLSKNLDTAYNKELENIINEKNQLELDKNNISYSQYLDKLKEVEVKETNLNEKYANDKLSIAKNTPKFISESDTEIPLELMYFINSIANQESIPSNLKNILTKQRNDLFDPLKKGMEINESLYTNPLEVFPEELADGSFGYITTPELMDSIKESFKQFKVEYDSVNSVEESNNLVKKINDYINNIDKLYKQFVPISMFEDNQEAYDYSANFFKEGLQNATNNIKPISNVLLEKADNILSKPVIEDKFLKILEQIHLDVFKGGSRDQVKILQIIKDEINQFEKDSTAPQNYVRTQNVINDLEEVRNTLNLIKSLTSAMLDSSSEGYNPYSFNDVMKKVAQENEENPDDYKTINGQTYNLLNKELNNLINKVEFLIDLAKTNSGTIWKNEEEIKNSIIKLKTNILTNENNPSSPLNIKINNKSLITSIDIDEINQKSISDEEKLWQIEDIIYNNFQIEFKENPEKALEELHSYFVDPIFVKNLVEMTDSGLYKNQEKLSDYDYFVYLHTILAIKNQNFYNNYKNILEKELTLQDKKVPFFSQENTIRTIYSYIQGKDIMNSIYDFIHKHINENPEVYKSNKAIMDSLFFVIGSGGVGKTSVISNYIARMLDSNEFDKFVSATDQFVLDKLYKEASRDIVKNNTVVENDKLGKVTESELLKLILNNDELFTNFNEAQELMLNYIQENAQNIVVTAPTNDLIDNHSFPVNNPVITINKYTEDDIKLSKEFKDKLKDIKLKKKTVIFADEVSYFSPLALQILSTIASNKDSNLYFIGSGDNLQDSFTLSEDNPFSLDHFHFISPPRLKGVIRGKNIHKKDNNENLEILVRKLINEEPIVDSVKVLTYYQTDKSLQGDKLVDKLTQYDLKSLDSSLDTVVITDSGELTQDTKDMLQKAGFDLNKVNVKKRTEIKGEEFDQVISLVDLPVENNKVSKSIAARRFYTLLTRAKVATIVVGNKEIIKSLGISNEVRKTTSSVELNTGDIEKELNKRVDTISNIFTNIEPKTSENTDPTITDEDIEPTNINSNPGIFPVTSTKDSDKDGFFVYSFSNILYGSLIDNKLDLKPLAEKEIPSDLQILNMLGVTEVDLNENGKEYVTNFIQMKNILLHRFVSGFKDSVSFKNNTIFSQLNKTLLSDGELVLRKLHVDGKYVESYGKQAHKLDENGEERSAIGKDLLYLSYKGKFKGKNFYITLAALPNSESINSKFQDKKNLLNNFYDKVQIGKDLSIKGNILDVYSGISFVNQNGKIVTKSSESDLKITGNTFNEFISNLQKAPGLMIKTSDKIEVFGYDQSKITKQFEETGYKKPKNVSSDNFSGKPYLQVSYVDPNNKNVSKIIVLNPKQRTLSEAVSDYKRLSENPSRNNAEFKMLISQYDGLDLLLKLPKSDQEKIISGLDQKYTDKIKILKNILSKGDLNIPISQKGQLTKGGFPNIGLRILGAIYNGQIEVSNDLLNSIGYYNQKYNFKKGESGEMFLPGDFIKYFSFPYYLEPPRFMINLGNIEIEPDKKEEEKIIKDIQPKANVINILGDPIVINTSNWSKTNKKPLQKMLGIINLATEKLNDSDVYKVMGDKVNNYRQIVLDITKDILSDPSVVNINNLNIDMSLIDSKVENYFESNEIFSENSMQFSDEQLDYLLNNFIFNSDLFNQILINYNLNNKDNDPCN